MVDHDYLQDETLHNVPRNDDDLSDTDDADTPNFTAFNVQNDDASDE